MRAIALAILILASSTAVHAQRKAVSAPMWPRQAAGLPTITLGELILRSLPRGSQMSWDALQIPSVHWLTDGIETTETGYSTRNGVARVRAAGAMPRMLRQGWVELGWSVSLEAEKTARFGPQKVVLRPGMADSEHMCFGTRFQGCSFPVAAMNASGLVLKKACERGPGSTHETVFAATAVGGRSGTVIYATDAGSGDATNSVEVIAGSAADYCARPSDY